MNTYRDYRAESKSRIWDKREKRKAEIHEVLPEQAQALLYSGDEQT